MKPLSRAISDFDYFRQLSLPADPIEAVGRLNGKSNYELWHSSVQNVLLTNPQSANLLLGTWTEPHFRDFAQFEDHDKFEDERRTWHAANVATCRFIRATLAEKVFPFVRQYSDARSPYLNLVWLYGEESGIDIRGGPPIPAGPQTLNARRGRAGLLAALEAKKTTIDQPNSPGLVLRPSTPITPSTIASTSSCLSTQKQAPQPSLNKQNKASTSTLEQHPTLIRSLERVTISAEPDLPPIPEVEEPLPGRRIRVSSGYTVGASMKQAKVSLGSISPLALSELDSDSEQDDLDLQDTDSSSKNPSSKKRQPSTVMAASTTKTGGIASFLSSGSGSDAKTKNKSKGTDVFASTFKLRRLNVNKNSITSRGTVV